MVCLDASLGGLWATSEHVKHLQHLLAVLQTRNEMVYYTSAASPHQPCELVAAANSPSSSHNIFHPIHRALYMN
jgi:hypothetical protein